MPPRSFPVDRRGRSGTVLEETLDHGPGPWHHHRRTQLLYAAAGVLELEHETGRWRLPPSRMAVLPGGAVHRATVHGRQTATLLSAYLEPRLVRSLPDHPLVFTAAPLLHHLLAHAAACAPGPARDRALVVLADALPAATAAPLALRLPRAHSDEVGRALAFAEAHPRDATLPAAAAAAAVAPRTLSRRWSEECGEAFRTTLRTIRILRATELLATTARPIGDIADDVGFASQSAFCHAFGLLLSQSPRAFRRGTHRARHAAPPSTETADDKPSVLL